MGVGNVEDACAVDGRGAHDGDAARSPVLGVCDVLTSVLAGAGIVMASR